jgi:hypothetical protein
VQVPCSGPYICLTPAEVNALSEAHHAAVRGYLVAEVFAVAWWRHDNVPTDDVLPWPLAVAGNLRRNQFRSARRHAAALGSLPLGGLSEDDQEIQRLVPGTGSPRGRWPGSSAARTAPSPHIGRMMVRHERAGGAPIGIARRWRGER